MMVEVFTFTVLVSEEKCKGGRASEPDPRQSATRRADHAHGPASSRVCARVLCAPTGVT
jgi:hypothetical protein